MIFHKTIKLRSKGTTIRAASASTASKPSFGEIIVKSGKTFDESTLINSEEYQLLHRSPVHTLKFQKSLPRLPIPKLEATCKRYLESQKAIIDDPEDYNRTEAIVNNFMKTEGVRESRLCATELISLLHYMKLFSN